MVSPIVLCSWWWCHAQMPQFVTRVFILYYFQQYGQCSYPTPSALAYCHPNTHPSRESAAETPSTENPHHHLIDHHSACHLGRTMNLGSLSCYRRQIQSHWTFSSLTRSTAKWSCARYPCFGHTLGKEQCFCICVRKWLLYEHATLQFSHTTHSYRCLFADIFASLFQETIHYNHSLIWHRGDRWCRGPANSLGVA